MKKNSYNFFFNLQEISDIDLLDIHIYPIMGEIHLFFPKLTLRLFVFKGDRLFNN